MIDWHQVEAAPLGGSPMLLNVLFGLVDADMEPGGDILSTHAWIVCATEHRTFARAAGANLATILGWMLLI